MQDYQILINHLNSLVNNNTILNYQITQLGIPQTTGIVKQQELVNNKVITKTLLYKLINNEYQSFELAKFYYFINNKIVESDTEFNSLEFPHSQLSASQVQMYLENPLVTYEEIFYMDYTNDIKDQMLRDAKKKLFNDKCSETILSNYSYAKQLNIINKNGYNDDDLFNMNIYIAKQRFKLSLLHGLVDIYDFNNLNQLNWEITYDELVNLILGYGGENSILVAKVNKLNDLKNWDYNVSKSGYFDETTNITLASLESDVIAFTKDLTGISSILKESETNQNIEIPQVWPFIDINNNFITTLTPIQYISLINRYFVYLRSIKFVYANYLYQIDSTQSLEDLQNITFGQ
jgi:hypothetical protein